MNQYQAMQRFIRVAELSSFTQAADSLGLPKASVSGAVQWLENRLGTRLLHRNTRNVSLTQDGARCLEQCRILLDNLEAFEGQFRRSPERLRGTLRIDMPSRFAGHALLPRLPEFLARHPELDIELSSSDRRVDLVAEGFDAVIRVGNLDDSSLIARPLGLYRVLNCVSPSYVSQFGLPQSLRALGEHRLIHYTQKIGSRPLGFEYVDKGRTRVLDMPGVITVNSTESYLDACLAGLGIAQIPDVGIRDALDSGALLSILPDYLAEPMPVNLLYSSRRNPSPRLRAFIEWLEQVVSEEG